MAGLMTVDNLVVGTDLIIGDADGGEVKGDKLLILFNFNGTTSVSRFLNCFDILGRDAGADEGYVTTRDGSITGVTVNYNITASSSASMIIQTFIGASSIFNLSLNDTVADGKTARITQARGVDVFNAGDIINSAFALLSGTATIEDIIVLMEIMYDA